MLDREWNNAQYFNMTILVLNNELWGDITRYMQNPKPKLYASIRARIIGCAGYLFNTPRIDMEKLDKIIETARTIKDGDFEALYNLAKDLSKLNREAKIMDFRGKQIYEDEVMSQAMK